MAARGLPFRNTRQDSRHSGLGHAAARRLRRNLQWAALLVLLVAVGFGLYAWQLGRRADGYLVRARAARDAGDHHAAIALLDAFLTIRPGDTAALVQLAELRAETAATRAERRAAYFACEGVLRRQPGREDLRRAAARLARELGRHRETLVHLEFLRKAHPEEVELILWEAEAHAAIGEPRAAVRAYLAAIDAVPERVPSYVALAEVILDHPSKLPCREDVEDLLVAEDLKALFRPREIAWHEGEDETAEALAERVLARAVQTGHPRHDAYVAFSEFLADQGRLTEASRTLELAVREAPQEPHVLFAAARVELDRALDLRPDEAAEQVRTLLYAEQLAARAGLPVERASDVALVRAEIALRLGRLESAAEHLRNGLSQTAGGVQEAGSEEPHDAEVQLRWALTNVLLALRRDPLVPLDQADEAELVSHIERLEGLQAAAELTDFLRGRLALARHNWHEAVTQLEDVRERLPHQSDLTGVLALLLAEGYERLARYEEEVLTLRRVIDRDDVSAAARDRLARVLAFLGRREEALEYLVLLTDRPGIPVRMAELLLLDVGKAPPEQRATATIHRALFLLEQGDDWPVREEQVRAEGLALLGDWDGAERLLQQACEARPDVAGNWAALAACRMLRPLGDPLSGEAAAEATLAQWQEQWGNSAELWIAQAQVSAEMSAPRGERLLASVAGALPRLAAADAGRVRVALADALERRGQWAEARRIVVELADEFPHELRFRFDAARLAAKLDDSAGLESELLLLGQIEGPGGPLGSYLRAAALISDDGRSMSTDEVARARQWLDAAEAVRSRWASIPAARSLLATRIGDDSLAHELLVEATARPHPMTGCLPFAWARRPPDRESLLDLLGPQAFPEAEPEEVEAVRPADDAPVVASQNAVPETENPPAAAVSLTGLGGLERERRLVTDGLGFQPVARVARPTRSRLGPSGDPELPLTASLAADLGRVPEVPSAMEIQYLDTHARPRVSNRALFLIFGAVGVTIFLLSMAAERSGGGRAALVLLPFAVAFVPLAYLLLDLLLRLTVG